MCAVPVQRETNPHLLMASAPLRDIFNIFVVLEVLDKHGMCTVLFVDSGFGSVMSVVSSTHWQAR